ncbi:MAG: LptF/LptG family permease [Steroidobacteraceae bacterium]
MSGVLGKHLRRRVAIQIFALLLVLTALMQVLELLDVTTDVLDRNLGVAGIVHYAALRLPSEMLLALPLAVLLGAMSVFYAMARTLEITALRASGVSVKSMVISLWPVPLLLAILQIALSQGLVPMSEAKLKLWWDQTAPSEDIPDIRRVQTSAGLVTFERNSPDGRFLQNIRIYQRGGNHLLTVRTMARRAEWTGNNWLLSSIQDFRVHDGVVTRTSQALRNWSANLRPADIVRLDVAQPHLSSIMLVDVIVGERVGTQPLSYYQTVLLRSFTAPISIFIMLLLAAPPATTMVRSGGGGGLLVALGLGLGFLLFDGIMSALGTGARVPAWVAAVTAPAVFTLIGLIQLNSCDRK